MSLGLTRIHIALMLGPLEVKSHTELVGEEAGLGRI